MHLGPDLFQSVYILGVLGFQAVNKCIRFKIFQMSQHIIQSSGSTQAFDIGIHVHKQIVDNGLILSRH